MANIMFMYDNLVLDATLAASSAASGFNAVNLQNPFRTKVWRTAGATAGTANLVINHGSAKAVTCVILGGYNWTSAPGTLDLEFNATDSWGSPSATESLTWAANPTTNGNYGVIVKVFDSKSYQYNRLNVVYSPGATPTDWDLGLLYVGTYFQPTDNYLISWGQSFHDPSIIDTTVGGQDHVDEMTMYRSLDFSFIIESQAQWESFQAVIRGVGTKKDLFIAFDYTNEPDEMTIYGKFTKLPGMQNIFNYNFRAPFSFKESR